MRVAIIGGGISGLSAAFYLEKQRSAGAQVEYTLFERDNRLGGSIFSEVVNGCVIEGGPDSFVTEKPWAANLCAELGLADQLIGSNDHERVTYIVVNGRLVPMPDGLMFMVPTKLVPTALTPLFSWSTKIRMGMELLHPPRAVGHDETVADMVRRHFGQEVVDRLAGPLLSGVYGGDVEELSVRAVLPRFVEMEEKYGSLTRGMLDAHNKMVAAKKKNPASKPRPLFTSLKSGMQTMINELVGRLNPSSLKTGVSVSSVAKNSSGWLVETSNGPEHFDAVIVTTQANVAGRLLQPIDAQLGQDLSSVIYTSSVTATLGYNMKDLAGVPEGFGFLVPRTEGTKMMACTFTHKKFPNRAPAGTALVRCFISAAKDESVLNLSDEEVRETCIRELQQILKVNTLSNPEFIRVYRWKGAMAQYTPGHLERVARIEKTLKALPGLAIAGNAFKGIGVPDCVRTGQEAAQSVLQSMNATAPEKVVSLRSGL